MVQKMATYTLGVKCCLFLTLVYTSQLRNQTCYLDSLMAREVFDDSDHCQTS